ncbi:murein biosynthesis integral membrane protein MurJ [Psychrosphaera aquimarina]|uniref:Probable lipid II flippase MurJ n=2 Tax=Psychrosphaera TaxID=907197 RepID=A0ABU3R3E3_9GAMM|nr:murein biosynthesis integral membrane protein MurJ [Psychrosphaera aquimarina]MDU0114201.1 murein biosynthesis integral membrane protein MurJ [Psychrosphaera aquimarina]
MHLALLRSGLIVSFMTLISRVLGLVRDVVIATLVGAGVNADVYFFANRIPNFLRRLFAEGAFAQAFVPVLTEVKEKHGDDEVRELVAKVAGTLGVIVTLITLFAVIASPLIVMVFGTGWFIEWMNDGPDAGKFEMASVLLKITFPYLFFITFVALSGAVLNTYNKFAVAAFTPVFLNIAIIVCAITLRDSFSDPAYALAIGVFLGGLIQFLFQLPFMAKAGLLVLPKWGWNDVYVKRIRILMLPAILGVSVHQLNALVDTVIASFLITGSISWLYYADRLIEFPLGLFGIGIATVILPSLSKLHSNDDPQAFQNTIDWAVRFVLMLAFPAMAGLMILGPLIIEVLYLHGKFTPDDAMHVQWALVAYCSGLMSYMTVKVLAPGYFARQDTKTPVRIGIISMLANIVFNFMLAPFFGFVGLAIATAMSGTLNAALLYKGLHQQGVYKISRQSLIWIGKLLLSTALMGYVVWLSHVNWPLEVTAFSHLLIKLFGLISIAIVCYFIALFSLGFRLRDLKSNF